MRGYGYSLPPAIITVVVICTIRIVWVYSVFAAKPTYEILMMVYPLSWLVTSVCLTILYFSVNFQRFSTPYPEVA